jgi:predicted transcriptional regulator
MKTKENKSIFLEYLGDTPQLRVIDFLIDNHFFDYPLTEIAKGSNVSYNSLVSFFSDWISKGIVVKTRKVGKSDYFKLNLENNFVKNLIQFDWSLVENRALKEKALEVNN